MFHIRHLLFALLLFLAMSCQKESFLSDPLCRFLPDEASLVTAFSAKQLLDDANYEEIKEMDFFRDFIQSMDNDFLSKLFENLEESGLAFDQTLYLAIKMEKGNRVDPRRSRMLAPLKDAQAFSQMIARLSGEAIQTGKQHQYIQSSGQSFVAWNEEAAIIGNKASQSGQDLDELFQGTTSSQLAGNQNLANCLSEVADINIWMNFDHLAEDDDLLNTLALSGIGANDLRGNFLHFFINFEPGLIDADFELFLTSKLKRDLRLFTHPKLSIDPSPYLLPKEPGIYFSAALDIPGIRQILKEKGVPMSLLNKNYSYLGFSAEDLLQALDGNLMLCWYPKGYGFVVAKIRKRAAFDKLLESGLQSGLIEKKAADDYTLFMPISGRIAGIPGRINDQNTLLIKQDVLYLTGEPEIAERLRAGPSNALPKISEEDYEKLNSHPLNLFLDQASLGNYLTKDTLNVFQSVQLNSSLTGGHLHLKLDQPNTNGLYRLIQLLEARFRSERKAPEQRI